MSKQKTSAPLPELVDEIDALRIENLMMKLGAAQVQLQQAGAAYNAAFEEAARRYGFDPTKDGLDFASRQIVRK